MRKLTKYVPRDDFDMPKEIDLERYTAVLIRQSDDRADEDHIFSRESQLQLPQYAMRLRKETTDKYIRVYDEGAGVSGQKRIDEREKLSELYNDIKFGFLDEEGVRRYIGSLVIIHEDRLFRDKYHTNDTVFIKLLAERKVLLFVRTDHRRYDCTKASDRNALLDKMIASRNYLDDHVIGRMNGNQEAKALQGLFTGSNLGMGFVTKGKKKEQVILVYEPWAKIVRWMFKRFKELDSFTKLGREIEAMPYLFPDPPLDDFMKYTFKVSMTKVPGGFKPSCIETVKYMLSNLSYAGALIYKGAIVRWDNHEAIIDKELALWAYHKITGRDIHGNPLENVERRRFHANGAEAVLKYIIHDPAGPLYTMHVDHPEYVRQSLISDHKRQGKLYRDISFAVRAALIDTIFLERVKAIALADRHLAEHIKASIDETEAQQAGVLVPIEDQLAQVALDIKKTLAFVHDQIFELTEDEKAKYNRTLAGLRQHEKELLEAQEKSTKLSLKEDYEELQDLLVDIPGRLDNCTMARKQQLARLITRRVTIEELSIHWLRLTVVWRGPLADRPDVCLIWRQRGKRSLKTWTPEEEAYVKEHYPTGDKWTMLEALPNKTWNMIREKAHRQGANRRMYINENVPLNVTVNDLNVIPDRELALQMAIEGGRRNNLVYGFWLYSADLKTVAYEVSHRDTNTGSWPNPFHSDSSASRSHLDPTSIWR